MYMFNLFFVDPSPIITIVMNITRYLQSDYIGDYIDLDENANANVFLAKPERVKMMIDENGHLKVKGKRYIRLGKIRLYDPVKQQNISNKEYVGIIDTESGEIQCFDIDDMYSHYIENNVGIMQASDKQYKISDQTKDIVVNTMLERKHATHIDFH